MAKSPDRDEADRMRGEAAADRLRTAPGDVIDAHVHLFSRGLFEEYLASTPDAPEVFKKAVKEGRFGPRDKALPDKGPVEMADWYVERLDAVSVAKAVVMSVIPDSDYMREFVLAGRGRLFALVNVDPRTPDAPDLLEREMEAGFRGVKLLPVNRRYRLSAEECRPFFERAERLGVTITIHYGVTIGPSGDMRYADPIDLSPVARDFPGVTFVIAHFGAGYLDQVLKVAYQCENICVDTSGTNNWIDFQVHLSSLAEVFDKAVRALGSRRVLFGTDSGNLAPYRSWIKYQQTRILERMCLSDADRDLILRGNAIRLFRLEE